MNEAHLERFDAPRKWFLRRSSRAGQPLIVALHGFSQFAGPPSIFRPWNFAELSGLLDLSISRDVSVCFPVGHWRNWGVNDAGDVSIIAYRAKDLSRAGQVFCFGFSDGATLMHEMAAYRERFSAVVSHSGLWPRWRVEVAPDSLPILLVCGGDDRTPVARQQEEIERKYAKSHRVSERWTVPNLGHSWAKHLNEEMLSWCQAKAAS